jgi:hypothetical protein
MNILPVVEDRQDSSGTLNESDQRIKNTYSYAIKYEDKYVRTGPWVRCRDYLLDIIVHEYTRISIDVYGFKVNSKAILLDPNDPILLSKMNDNEELDAHVVLEESNKFLGKMGLENLILGAVNLFEGRDNLIGFKLSPICGKNPTINSVVTSVIRAAIAKIKGIKDANQTAEFIKELTTDLPNENMHNPARFWKTGGTHLLLDENLNVENLNLPEKYPHIEYGVHDCTGPIAIASNAMYYKSRDIPESHIHRKFLESLHNADKEK